MLGHLNSRNHRARLRRVPINDYYNGLMDDDTAAERQREPEEIRVEYQEAYERGEGERNRINNHNLLVARIGQVLAGDGGGDRPVGPIVPMRGQMDDQ